MEYVIVQYQNKKFVLVRINDFAMQYTSQLSRLRNIISMRFVHMPVIFISENKCFGRDDLIIAVRKLDINQLPWKKLKI